MIQNWFENLPIGQRLSIIWLIPLSALVALSIFLIGAKWRQQSDLEALKVLTGDVVIISNLVHELQKERGLSNIYTASRADDDNKRMVLQREQTDAKAREFVEAVSRSSKSIRVSANLDISDVGSQLTRLAETRKAIDADQIPSDDSFRNFTSAIQIMLQFSAAIQSSVRAEDAVHEILAFVALSEAKERAGQERATIGKAISEQRVERDIRDRLLQLISQQDIFFGMFLSEARPVVKKFFETTNDPTLISAINNIRFKVLNASDTRDFQDLSPTNWFQLATQRIDTLKSIEDKLSAELVELTNNGIIRVREELVSISVICALLAGITFVLSYMITKSIVYPLERITVGMKKIITETGSAMKAGDRPASEIGEAMTYFRLLQGLNLASRSEFNAEQLRKLQEAEKFQTEAFEKQRIAAAAFEVTDGMMVTDENGIILQVNRAFSQITGYQAAEVIGKTPSILKSGRQSEVFYRNMWASMHRNGYWQGEIWNRRKNGQVYPEWLTITAVRSEETGEIANFVAALSDVSDRVRAAEEINRLAFQDPLTSLPNRRLFMDRLGHAIANSRRSKRHGAIFFMDLDHFKLINDTLGHEVGDKLLKFVGKILLESVRETDTVARLGGDEFVLLLENLDQDVSAAARHAEMVGQKIMKKLASSCEIDGHALKITTSIGVLLFQGHDKNVDEILRNADVALYHSKSLGRNALTFFDKQMQANVVERAKLENDLRFALSDGKFSAYLQPQVNAAGQLTGAEALLRWFDGERGAISPGVFIPVAEEIGLMSEIGRYVLRLCCRQLRAWREEGVFKDLTIAVNISIQQFRDPKFIEEIEGILIEAGLRPADIKLELTESLIINDLNDALRKIRSLKDKGFKFSMDDFGTGYSSFSYLSYLPFDEVKIDQSFVRRMGENKKDEKIVRAIIELAHALDMEIVAEGVETDIEYGALRNVGCKIFQGYHFGRPVSFEQFRRDWQTN